MGSLSLSYYTSGESVSYVDYICIINNHIRKDLMKKIKNNRYIGNAHNIPGQTFSPGRVRGGAGQDGGHMTYHSTSAFNTRIKYL